MAHQDMFDPQMRLSHNVKMVRKEEVVVLMDAPGKRILDGDHPAVYMPPFDRIEYLFKGVKWYGCAARAEHFASGDLTVRAVNALKACFHHNPYMLFTNVSIVRTSAM